MMYRLLRLTTLSVAVLATLGLSPWTSGRAEAQVVTGIRYFAVPNRDRPKELFEILDDPRIGGRLVRDGRRETIPGEDGGVSIGYTDRAERRERVVTQVLGQGTVALQLRRNGRAVVTAPSVPLPLLSDRRRVSPDPNFDNTSVAALKGNRVIAERRLRVGTRP